jgi:hypothetical protein
MASARSGPAYRSHTGTTTEVLTRGSLSTGWQYR